MNRGPVFIGGLECSGTSLIYALLASHPNIAMTRRTYLWAYFYNRFGDLGKPANFERCFEILMHYKRVLVLNPDPDRLRREFQQGEPTYARLFSLIEEHYAEQLGKPRWGDKSLNTERYADPIFAAYPTARILHMIRDPRDRYASAVTRWKVDLAVNAQRALLESGLLAKAAALRRWRTEQREEVRAYRRAGRIWALTARDAQSARTLSGGSASVSVLPFGLPEAKFTALRERTSREVLFMGAMGAAFNRDALDFFARRVHPLLADIEGIRFTVVGGALPPSLEFFAGFRHVEVAGHARDVSPFLERCACLVVPLRYGGGIRIRILEAIAAGAPLVDNTAGERVAIQRIPTKNPGAIK